MTIARRAFCLQSPVSEGQVAATSNCPSSRLKTTTLGKGKSRPLIHQYGWIIFRPATTP